MAFVIQNSTGGPLPQDAMRSIVEAVDTWRGQNVAFVVFRDQPPYEIVSVHATDDAARTAATAGSGLNYFGLVALRSQARSYVKILKTTGCGLRPVAASVSKIVLRDAHDVDVEQYTVNDGVRRPDRERRAAQGLPRRRRRDHRGRGLGRLQPRGDGAHLGRAGGASA